MGSGFLDTYRESLGNNAFGLRYLLAAAVLAHVENEQKGTKDDRSNKSRCIHPIRHIG